MDFQNSFYFDITGTLIAYDNPQQEVEAMDDVMAFAMYVQNNRRRPVYMCSRIEENAIMPWALKQRFHDPYIYGKASLQSHILGVLVDNNRDEYLKARRTIHPQELEGFAGLSPAQQDHVFLSLIGEDPGSTPGENFSDPNGP